MAMPMMKEPNWEIHYTVNTPIQKDTDMTYKNERDKKLRSDLRSDIIEALHLAISDALLRIESRDWKLLPMEKDKTGPLGGISSGFMGFVYEGEPGTLMAFSVNVYSDAKIDAAAHAILEEQHREQEQVNLIFGKKGKR